VVRETSPNASPCRRSNYVSKPIAEDMLGSSARRAQRRLNTALGRNWKLSPVTLSNAQLEEFLSQSAASFQGAEHDDNSIRAFLIRYLRAGRHQGLSQGELIDHLAVSSPSVLERAGIDAHVQECILAVLSSLPDDELH
jgi:hypothetical protein